MATWLECMAPRCIKAAVHLEEAEEAIRQEAGRVADMVIPCELVEAVRKAGSIAICMNKYPYADLALKTMLVRMGKDVDVIPCDFVYMAKHIRALDGYIQRASSRIDGGFELDEMTIAEHAPDKKYDLQIAHNDVYEDGTFESIRQRSALQMRMTADKSVQTECRMDETLKQVDRDAKPNPFYGEEYRVWDESQMVRVPPDVILCYAFADRFGMDIDDEVKPYIRALILTKHDYWPESWSTYDGHWFYEIG